MGKYYKELYEEWFLKILIVNGGMLDYGGISAYIMNYYRKMDKKI